MKKTFICLFLLLLCLTSCGNFGEYEPESIVKESEIKGPADFTPDTTDKGGLTINEHSLDNIPLNEILTQMLDTVDYDFEDKFSSRKIDLNEFKDKFSAEEIDFSAVEEVLYYGPNEKETEFALILARLADGTDMAEFGERVENAANSAAEKNGKEIDVVSSYTGRVMFFLLAEKGKIGDEDVATLLGSFASVDADKYNPDAS